MNYTETPVVTQLDPTGGSVSVSASARLQVGFLGLSRAKSRRYGTPTRYRGENWFDKLRTGFG